jgi:SAM-dependent methyltransferase
MLQIYADAKTDSTLADALTLYHAQENCEEAFEGYAASPLPRAISDLLARLGVQKHHAVCDMGCGKGRLAFALHRLGYVDVSAMDPNDQWYSGTGFLNSIAGSDIKIINAIAEWRNIFNRFDALLSASTIHHWQNIPRVALDARRTMKPGGIWIAFAEWFADTPAEFVREMTTHPTRTRYKNYEWAYPASAYVDLIQSVGFELIAVIPLYYRNNEFVQSKPAHPGDATITEIDSLVDRKLVGRPDGTVDLFWAEVGRQRNHPEANIFTRPQAFVFQRIGV